MLRDHREFHTCMPRRHDRSLADFASFILTTQGHRFISNSGPKVDRAARHKNLLGMKIRPRLKQDYQPNFHLLNVLLVTGIQLLFACPKNHVEIWLVILF